MAETTANSSPDSRLYLADIYRHFSDLVDSICFNFVISIFSASMSIPLLGFPTSIIPIRHLEIVFSRRETIISLTKFISNEPGQVCQIYVSLRILLALHYMCCIKYRGCFSLEIHSLLAYGCVPYVLVYAFYQPGILLLLWVKEISGYHYIRINLQIQPNMSTCWSLWNCRKESFSYCTAFPPPSVLLQLSYAVLIVDIRLQSFSTLLMERRDDSPLASLVLRMKI